MRRRYRPAALVAVGLVMFLAGCAPMQRLHATQVIWRFFAAHPRPRSG